MKTCSSCCRDKPLSEFHRRKDSPDGLGYSCKACRGGIARRWRDRNPQYSAKNKNRMRPVNRRRLFNYLLTQECVDCGERNPLVLDFDHVVGTKRAAVGKMLAGTYSWSSIMEEVSKCVVRCANCHRIKTAHEQGWDMVRWLSDPPTAEHSQK
jgi:hypothetical protein